MRDVQRRDMLEIDGGPTPSRSSRRGTSWLQHLLWLGAVPPIALFVLAPTQAFNSLWSVGLWWAGVAAFSKAGLVAIENARTGHRAPSATRVSEIVTHLFVALLVGFVGYIWMGVQQYASDDVPVLTVVLAGVAVLILARGVWRAVRA